MLNHHRTYVLPLNPTCKEQASRKARIPVIQLPHITYDSVHSSYVRISLALIPFKTQSQLTKFFIQSCYPSS